MQNISAEHRTSYYIACSIYCSHQLSVTRSTSAVYPLPHPKLPTNHTQHDYRFKPHRQTETLGRFSCFPPLGSFDCWGESLSIESAFFSACVLTRLLRVRQEILLTSKAVRSHSSSLPVPLERLLFNSVSLREPPKLLVLKHLGVVQDPEVKAATGEITRQAIVSNPTLT